MPLKAKLIIKNGEFAGAVISLVQGQSLTLGRSDAANVVLPDGKVSRVHCKIDFDGQGCQVEDMDSRNGTFVNSLRIKAQPVKTGDEIRVGDTCIALDLVDASQKSEIALARPPLPKAPTAANDPFETLPPDSIPALGRTASPVPGSKSSGIREGIPGGPSPEELAFISAHRFCDACGKMILKQEIAQGKVRVVAGKVLCSQCDSLSVGKVIGQYRILEKIGQGTMGVVFKAEHVTMKRIVALKILFEHLTSNKDNVNRFLREAMAGASLNHPNIIQMFDAGDDHGFYYIVMEYIHGKTLEELVIESGPFPPAKALDVCTQIARALQYAFQKKIVHRDLRPANIIYTEDGVAKVIDMGTIKSLESSGLSTLTRTGISFGVINFASPEQIFDAKSVDHRADIYSLGASLYYILSGELPYQAKSPKEFFEKVTAESLRSLREVNENIPEALWQFVRKMMKKDPKDRFQTPDELVAEMTEFVLGQFTAQQLLDEGIRESAGRTASAASGRPRPGSGILPGLSGPARDVPVGPATPAGPVVVVPSLASASLVGPDEEQLSAYDVRVAKEVQQKLVPNILPQIQNYELFHLYKPAKEVGGDYVDFFGIGNHRYVTIIADVSGKGISGAMVMVMVRQVMRMIGPLGLSPKETLIKANRLVLKDIRKGMFVSAIYGVLDCANHTFSMASAGHNPPVIWKTRTRQADLINVKGMVLGFCGDKKFDTSLEECKIDLEPMDRILLYTDGVTEAKNMKGEDLTEEVLCSVVSQFSSAGSRELIGEVMKSIDDHRGAAKQSDDITMFGLRCLSK
ncbi:MAG: SpoIIE family protein phosphatase [Planctomycetes bacterium]|nr:SpoIIE family protein phosphatase [Planctomycetota bacterium]